MGLIEYLFLPPGPAGAFFDRWGAVLFGAYLGIAASLLVLGWVMAQLSARNAVRAQVTRRVVTWGLGVQVVALVFLGLRLANIPVLSMRLLLYASVALEVVAVGYLIRWMSTRYPGVLEQYEFEERKRAYIPRGSGGTRESARRTAARRK